jgi:hypothetical protein
MTLTWLNRSTLTRLADNPHVRSVALGVVLLVTVPLVAGLLVGFVPPLLQPMASSYVIVLLISVATWLMTLRGRLWLALLIGTTVWSLAMLALAIWSLMECMGA